MGTPDSARTARTFPEAPSPAVTNGACRMLARWTATNGARREVPLQRPPICPSLPRRRHRWRRLPVTRPPPRPMTWVPVPHPPRCPGEEYLHPRPPPTPRLIRTVRLPTTSRQTTRTATCSSTLCPSSLPARSSISPRRDYSSTCGLPLIASSPAARFTCTSPRLTNPGPQVSHEADPNPNPHPNPHPHPDPHPHPNPNPHPHPHPNQAGLLDALKPRGLGDVPWRGGLSRGVPGATAFTLRDLRASGLCGRTQRARTPDQQTGSQAGLVLLLTRLRHALGRRRREHAV